MIMMMKIVALRKYKMMAFEIDKKSVNNKENNSLAERKIKFLRIFKP